MLALVFTVFVWWPLGVLWKGYAIAVLWEWFFVPVGAQPLSIYLIVAGCLILDLALPWRRIDRSDKRGNWTKIGEGIFRSITVPALALGLGYLWHWLQWGVS